MYTYWLNIILFKYLVKHIFYYDVKKSEVRQELANGKVNVTLCRNCYLVDPASSHTLVLKIKPCMSKCFVIITLDCRRLIITVIVLLRLFYRWIPVVIPFFGRNNLLGNPPIDRWILWVIPFFGGNNLLGKLPIDR